MRKLIAGINMTIDGYCDHTAIDPDADIHNHYTELLNEVDTLLYGRITYDLMQFWQTLIKTPSGEKSMDDFALAIDKIPKIVFSDTMKDTGWHSAALAHQSLEDTVKQLKQRPGRAILAGSRSIIIQLLQLKLVDELQLCIHPVAAGAGLPLFEHLKERVEFKLTKTKTFDCGAIIQYYEPLLTSSRNI